MCDTRSRSPHPRRHLSRRPRSYPARPTGHAQCSGCAQRSRAGAPRRPPHHRAAAAKESRGGQTRDDFPTADPEMGKVNFVERIADLDAAALARLGPIGPERADLMLAGCAIFGAICALWPSRMLRVADRGLREGMLRQLRQELGL